MLLVVLLVVVVVVVVVVVIEEVELEVVDRPAVVVTVTVVP